MHSDLKHNNKQKVGPLCSQNVHNFLTYINIRTLDISLFLKIFSWNVSVFLCGLFCSGQLTLNWVGIGRSFIEIHHPWIYLKFWPLSYRGKYRELCIRNICNCSIVWTVSQYRLILMFIKMNERGVLMFLSHKLVNRTTVETEVLALWLLCILLIV